MKTTEIPTCGPVLRWISPELLLTLLRPFVQRQGHSVFDMDAVICDGLGLNPAEAGRAKRTKIGIALSSLGVARHELRGNEPRFVYRVRTKGAFGSLRGVA